MKQLSPDKFDKDKKGFIYYWYGGSMLLLKDLRSEMHKHFPIELYIGLDDDFDINLGEGWIKCRAILVDSNQQHQIIGRNGFLALFLLNPNFYNIKRVKSENFSDNRYLKPTMEHIVPQIERINKFMSYPRTCEDAKKLTEELVPSLCNLEIYNRDLDPRIKRILDMLEDIPEKKISSSELAKWVNLSESRLCHFFRKEIGTTIRRYLLWLRLREAIKLILKGNSFTAAAHESGFSDSAHLSRTYRQMFGIPPSNLLKSYNSIEQISLF